jgi:hypothetical protein
VSWLIFVGIGISSGLLAGIFGLGGGVVLVPALIYFAGFSQKLAVGTTLAVMLPPLGIAAVIEYYKHGNVDFKVAAIIAVSLIVGSWFGAKIANGMSEPTLKVLFGLFLVLLGIYTIIKAS